MEKLLAEFDEQVKKVEAELKKKNEVMARLEADVAKLEKQQAFSKKLAIEEFKSSEDFKDFVESETSKYFGEGFDFCKRQLAHHHPNLGIYLDDMDKDRELLKKEEVEAEENKEKGEGKGDINPLSP